MASYNAASQVRTFDLSGDPYIDSLYDPDADFRNAWSTVSGGKTQITYSFPWAGGVASRFIDSYGYGENTAATTAALDAGQMQAARQAFAQWANVANVAFSEVTETAAGQVGDIRIAFSSEVGADFWGYQISSGGGQTNDHGDIWINTDIIGKAMAPGTFDFVAMMHEIGHALGLDHPFSGNVIPAGYDNTRYTIMSYTDPDDVWFLDPKTGEARFLLTTPMVYDIAAVQRLYGANTAYHAGADTYTYRPDAPFYATIWDGGGVDTINLAAFAKGCTVDLQPGSYSSLNFTDLAMTDNLGIAFGCVIENVTGGKGADTIIGNEARNSMKGGGGADTIDGAGGNDTLLGGPGNDKLTGGAGDDTFLAFGDAANDTLIGGDGQDTVTYLSARAAMRIDLGAGTASGLAPGDAARTGLDTLSGIERVIGSAFADQLIGGASADRLDGAGGADTMAGNAGDDSYTVDNGADSVTELAGQGTDTVVSSVDWTLGINVENLTLAGSAARATGNAAANTLRASGADCRLTGLGGNDTLIGSGGADVLTGGAGRDTMTGGAGADRFVFATGDIAGGTTAKADRITDFRHAQADVIDLSGLDAIAGTAGDDAFAFIGTAAFGGHAGELRYQVSGSLGYLLGDTGGDGVADLAIRLDGAPAIVAADLVL